VTSDSEISLGDTFLAEGPPPGTGEAAAIEALRRAVLDPARQLSATDVLDDRYRLVDVLGRGGMGVVWRARDERLDRDVALKLLEGHLTTERLARMRREAQAVAQLAHPNVVPVYDVGLHGARPYLVMELVVGQELGAWMKAEPAPSWQQVVVAFVAAGRGLVAAHDAGLVHRDFKPANVLMGDDGRPRVVDFGLARYRDDLPSEPDSAPLTEASLTMTGVAVGTPAYMAPEQHEGEDATAATDIFGFAVSLYEGLFGERPHAARDLVSLLEAKRAGPPSRPPVSSSTVPHRVFEVVTRGMAPKPEDRWPSMRAFVAELDRVVRPRRAVALGLAVLALGGLAWLGVRPTDSDAVACRSKIESFSVDFDARRKALLQRLDEADVSGPTRRAVVGVLAEYEGSWRDAAQTGCQADRAPGAVPASRVEECLTRSQAAMSRQLDAGAASVAAARAFDSRLRDLPDATDCTDRMLANREPLPGDPQTRRRVEALAEWVAQPRTTDEGIALLADVPDKLAEARMLGHRPTAAAIALEASLWATNNGDNAQGNAYCTEAYDLAAAGGADRIAMRSAHECLTTSAWLGDIDGARRWHREAAALRERVNAAPHIAMEARADLAMGLRIADETDEARALSAQVFAEAMALPWHDRHSIHAFVTLGSVSIWLEDYEHAKERFEASLDRAEEYYPGNADAVVPAQTQLGTVYRYLEQPAAAERMYRKVLAQDVPAGLRQQTQLNLALLLAEDPQRGEEARSLVVAFEQHLRDSNKVDSFEMGIAWAAKGHVERKLGNVDGARTAYRSALEVYGRHLEPGHVRIVDVEDKLAGLSAEGIEP